MLMFPPGNDLHTHSQREPSCLGAVSTCLSQATDDFLRADTQPVGSHL